MNIEEQSLDLCSVKAKSSVDHDHTTSTHTEGVLSRIAELMMDGDMGKQNNVATEPCETYLLPQLTDPLRGVQEDNHPAPETRGLDEVNGNKTSGAPDGTTAGHPKDGSALEQNQGDVRVDVIEQGNTESAKFAVVDDGGDMDIGVDLSLDESGVLEADPESAEPSVTVESAAAATCRFTNKEAESPSERVQDRTEAAGAHDQALSPPSLEDGEEHHRADAKKVTFPSDEDIVSGAVEPKDPWRHAQNVTVEEILTAYRQGCQKLNCKPIAKVLKQIQELKDLTQRNECLDLKGEKLDYKACESLEEVLKRVQFKLLDLEQTNLDEDGASALFDMIEYYESATHLNISFNKHIGTRGWQAAAHMMRKTSSLQYLDARNSPLLDHSAPFVARALRISGSLVVLHLENAGLSGRPLMLLATALKMNMNLRELYLADNKLNGLQDSAQLGNLLKFNYNIQILDLRNNHILDSGLAYVCEGLKEQRKGLVTLVLWNNQLTHNGMGYLAAALPCTQSLETLNLGHNSIGNEGVHRLKDGLISNRSVLRLGLASTKLSCEGAVAVAEFIAESPRLLRLDLRENEIKTGGLMALSLALKVNTSLLRLDLDREPKKETVKSFIETQRALLAEIQNGCKRNFILAKEKEETDQKMRQSASMAEIATEDGPGTEEDPSDGPGPKAGLENEGDGEAEDSQSETGGLLSEASSGQSETSVRPAQTTPETEAPLLPEDSDSDSDSDTEDEEEEEEEEVQAEAPSSSSPRRQLEPAPRGASRVPPPSPAVPIAGKSVLPAITVTESPLHHGAPPSPGRLVSVSSPVTEPPLHHGAPPSPGRLISVSSPGKGYKIFMVTRVESPPDQQQVKVVHQSNRSQLGFPTPADEPGEAQQSQEGPPQSSPLTDSPRAPTLQPPGPPADDAPASESQSPRLTERSPPVHAAPAAPAPPPATPQTLPERPEGVPEAPDPQVRAEEQSRQLAANGSAGAHAVDPERPRPGGPQSPSSSRTQPAVRVAAQSDLQVAPEAAWESTEEGAEGPAEKMAAAEQQGAGGGVQLVAPQAGMQAVPETLEETQTPPPGEGPPPSAWEDDPFSPLQPDLPPHGGAADEGGCPGPGSLREAGPAAALPNGLRAEFSLHLLEHGEGPKPASCLLEHVSAAAELTCGQDVETRLLDASLETHRRDLP
ncbi:unnamed protein product [Lota lota]